MRLIDADTLIKELHEAICTDVDLRKDYEFMGIDEFIKNQPTAYDKDKVVEEICSCDGCSGCCFCHEEQKMMECEEYARVYKIVKGGGISE